MSEENIQLNGLSAEEIQKIKDDLANANESLVSKGTQEVIEAEKRKAAEEARIQFEKEQLAKEQEAKIKQLEEEKIAQEKAAAERLAAMEAKINDMVSSKAVVSGNDPFQQRNNNTLDFDNMSDDQINKIEEDAARAFFGNDYDTRD